MELVEAIQQALLLYDENKENNFVEYSLRISYNICKR